MRPCWLWCAILIGLNGLLSSCLQSPAGTSSPPVVQPSVTPRSATPEKSLEYNLHKLPNSLVHTLKIPIASQFVVTPAVSNTLETVEQFAESTGAIAVLNGGFFDPQNQKSTSSIVLQGKPVARPEDNERLMNNPELLTYLDKILNRSEFRRYRCGSIRYDIALRQDLPPANCQLEAALGAGPRLLPFIPLEQEGFLDRQNGKVIRDAVGSNQPNARTAIGILPDGSLVWVLAAQRPDIPGSGLSLPELADFMKQIGAEQGLNLDGGSSTSMYFQGETFYGKLDQAGEPITRSVKSVLIVQLVKKPEKPPV